MHPFILKEIISVTMILFAIIDILGAIPVIGLMLRANKDGRDAYAAMVESTEFQHPVSWSQASLDDIDAFACHPGGTKVRAVHGPDQTAPGDQYPHQASAEALSAPSATDLAISRVLVLCSRLARTRRSRLVSSE